MWSRWTTASALSRRVGANDAGAQTAPRYRNRRRFTSQSGGRALSPRAAADVRKQYVGRQPGWAVCLPCNRDGESGQEASVPLGTSRARGWGWGRVVIACVASQRNLITNRCCWLTNKSAQQLLIIAISGKADTLNMMTCFVFQDIIGQQRYPTVIGRRRTRDGRVRTGYVEAPCRDSDD